MTDTPGFWIDHEYDREQASNGRSRYGAYVRQSTHRFTEITEWDDATHRTTEFAALVWRTATGPVMSPGYVRSHERVQSAELHRSEENGHLVAVVDIITPLPAVLATSYIRGFHTWRKDPWGYPGIGDRDVASSSYMLPSVRILTQLPMDALPDFTGFTDVYALELEAAHTVATLVHLLNSVINPIISAIGED